MRENLLSRFSALSKKKKQKKLPYVTPHKMWGCFFLSSLSMGKNRLMMSV